MNLETGKPYNSLPPLPPPPEKIESVAVLKQESKAAVALAELKGRIYILTSSLDMSDTERSEDYNLVYGFIQSR